MVFHFMTANNKEYEGGPGSGYPTGGKAAGPRLLNLPPVLGTYGFAPCLLPGSGGELPIGPQYGSGPPLISLASNLTM